jgi:hypothetical protein
VEISIDLSVPVGVWDRGSPTEALTPTEELQDQGREDIDEILIVMAKQTPRIWPARPPIELIPPADGGPTQLGAVAILGEGADQQVGVVVTFPGCWTNSPVEPSSSAIVGTAKVRKKASSADRVTSKGNSKQASR